MAEQKRNTKPLTPASIASARPRAKPYEMSDAASGLRLNVSPTGVRSWRWYVKDKGTGKTRKITLGTFPSLSLGDARTKIEDLKEAHKTGHLADLVESRRARAAPDAPAGALTVAGFAPMFMQTIQRRRERPEQVQRVLDNDLIPALGHRPLASITTLDAARVVEDVVEGAGWREGKGASTYAGNVLQVVKQFFRVARSKGLVIVNPADTLDPDDLGIVHRVCDRFLSPKEIEQFWKALESPQGTTPTVRNALRLLLLTGVRSGELLLAEWSEIDLDEGKPEAAAQAHVDDPGRAPEADEEAEGEGSQALPRPPDADDDRDPPQPARLRRQHREHLRPGLLPREAGPGDREEDRRRPDREVAEPRHAPPLHPR